jgi:hypothetical protein
MNELEQQLDTIKRHSPIQYEFIYWRSVLPSANAALEKIQRTTGWLHTQANKDELLDLSDQLRVDRITQASIMLRNAVLDAVNVMTDDLKSHDRKLRQAAAKDILDRVGLRAPDKTQVEVMASVAVRALDDVLAQVYGRDTPALPAGDIVDGEIVDGEIVDNADDN